MARYSVEMWGSHPDLENDDHWTGYGFDDFASAKRAFDAGNTEHFRASDLQGTTHLELCETFVQDGKEYVNRLDVRQCKTDAEIARMEREARDDSDWMREIAMQAGMGCGVHAYNEVMGY